MQKSFGVERARGSGHVGQVGDDVDHPALEGLAVEDEPTCSAIIIPQQGRLGIPQKSKVD